MPIFKKPPRNFRKENSRFCQLKLVCSLLKNVHNKSLSRFYLPEESSVLEKCPQPIWCHRMIFGRGVCCRWHLESWRRGWRWMRDPLVSHCHWPPKWWWWCPPARSQAWFESKFRRLPGQHETSRNNDSTLEVEAKKLFTKEPLIFCRFVSLTHNDKQKSWNESFLGRKKCTLS